ncbi:outer membrane protein assembly factor BamB family protein [Novipirellula artificiosorum]|uniref:Outer membrane biogenesis protein BamB n=1 Tax=Novipirellula artificiosorum TaxID=2528016 RepID=A0A5C6DLS5_9BACT|nr:PQQ-binding-like beta-propeller repeat protein [Novipirellula artificiosorum]TWU37135.1 outer membrane biogenesis protein BamB [Novipirellula artificiosorum]
MQRFLISTLPLLCFFVVVNSSQADNWPQWRGPTGDGVIEETEVPTEWDEESGVQWKCPLPGWGDSTPAIWGDAVFVTSCVDEESLVLLKINKKTGEVEWTRQVGTATALRVKVLKKVPEMRRHQQFHDSHNMASPSPTTDGELVIAHFGNGDLAAYDFQGNLLWKRNLQQDHGDYTIWWGHANSPVLHGDLVISVCMQDSCSDLPGDVSPSYVVAHDKRTGKQKWKTMRMTSARGEHGDGYTTPLLRHAGERTELIVMGGQMLDAYDPATGKQLWRLSDLDGNRVIPNPIVADQLIIATQGMRQAMLAIRPSGDGDLSRKDIVWSFDQGTSDSPSPVVWEDFVFFISNNGIARCLDLHTGQEHWKERLAGEYRASLLAADGKVYFFNMDGLATVVSASKDFRRLSENQLQDRTLASPAVSDGTIFVRGRTSLYCLSQ